MSERVELQVDSGKIGSAHPEKVYCKYWEMYVDRNHCKHFPDREGCAGGCPGPHGNEKKG